MAFSFQPKIVSDELVLYVDAGNTKSYPNSGTVWTDLSKTQKTGSLTNGPTFSSATGGSIVFDGTNDFVRISNITTPTYPFTINAWFRSSIVQNGFICDYCSSVNNDPHFTIKVSGSKIQMAAEQPSPGGEQAANSGIDYSVNTIYNVTGIYHSATSRDLYVNGTYQTSSTTSVTISSQIDRFSIGVFDRPTPAAYFSGSVFQVSVYNRALSATEVLQNYTALSGRFGKTPTITDYDALNFVNAALISNETQQIAINTLTTDLKNAGLWSKMKAIYPFVGGTASTHRWNLKDPRNVDAAFRLTFSGGWTHSSTGALPNGTNGYADTFLIPSTTLTNNSTHLAYYSRTAAASGTPGVSTGTDIGALSSFSGNIPLLQLVVRGDFESLKITVSNHYSALNQINVEQLSGQGLFVGTRTSISSHKSYKNGSTLVSDTNNSNTNTTSVTHKLYIAARNDAGSVFQYSNKEASFVSIGDGLTDTDAANLYTIVQKYQTTLGRQV